MFHSLRQRVRERPRNGAASGACTLLASTLQIFPTLHITIDSPTSTSPKQVLSHPTANLNQIIIMDDFDIDPAIAEAMGFSGFGKAPNKKRKHDNDMFIDPDITTPQGTSANNAPLGERKSKKTTEGIVDPSQTAEVPFRPEPQPQRSGPRPHEVDSNGAPTLQALRNGVRNERGDLAIFLPSFIEDPWAGLKAQ